MYVQHSVHIKRPVDDCASRLAAGPRTWFPSLQSDSDTEVGFRVAGISVKKKVRVNLGTALTHGDWTEVPFSWRATFPEQLFPEMVGRIELVPVDSTTTRLTLSGMYEPPLGRLGTVLDERVMHTVAEATVSELAESIAKQLSGA